MVASTWRRVMPGSFMARDSSIRSSAAACAPGMRATLRDTTSSSHAHRPGQAAPRRESDLTRARSTGLRDSGSIARMPFQLRSTYSPRGDQPEAIEQLLQGLQRGDRHQTLLGTTGSGKTFSAAHVIARWNRPALVISHNKTLAAQLYGEFRQFF